jgi:hypothetical protein
MKQPPKVLVAPQLPAHLSATAQWLAGEGAGSWFELTQAENSLIFGIKRYSPDGGLECEGQFTADTKINITDTFSITYPSHCAVVTLLQNTEKITLKRI